MKIKLLTSVLCAFLVIGLFTGCGMKLPETSEGSPSASASSSPTGDALFSTTTVTGIVSFVDEAAIKIDLVAKNDAPAVDNAQTLSVGGVTFVVTGEAYTVKTEVRTAVVLEYLGYTAGSLGDIKEGDFLAVSIRDNMAIAIIDGGPTAVNNASESDPPTTEPTNEPTDPSTEPSAGVPDSSVKTVYTVITDGLKARSGPSTTDSILGVLDKGSRAIGIVTNGWLEFTYNGKTAYCSAEYLEVSTAPEGVPDSTASKTYTTTENVKARSGPGTTNPALGTLDKGTKVTGTVSNGWLKFTYEDKTAYCSASYLAAS